MPKIIIAIAVSLLAGFAAAALMMKEAAPIATEVSGFDSSATIDDRLKSLEDAVNAERRARQLLEEELFILYEELDSLEGARAADFTPEVVARINEAMVDDRAREIRARGRANIGNETDQRRAALMEAGFSPSRADWIIQRESELRMQAMQTRYDAMRAGDSPNRGYDFATPEIGLREEMGDAQFETYLQAQGRSTAVGVGAVYESSPAQTAGLQPGDEITHYDGARVFNTFDLTRQTMEGGAGENVVVNITRDGIPMQVVIPRGPLGINTSRRR
jgi:PDZ domain